MKRTLLLGALLLGILPSLRAEEKPAALNTLTDAEKAEGWVLLFDGKSLSKSRNYQKQEINDKWKIEDGIFTLTEKGGGDIITRDEYGAFELMLDYRIAPEGNSGLMFHVGEAEKTPWMTGPEIQIQDNEAGHDPQKAGWLYQLYPASVDATHPAGEWNSLHIIISPEKCVHIMNGTKYVEYVKGSADWDAKVAASKFSKFPNFGKLTKGFICLQDHGNVVSFRNVKIKSLD